MTTNDAAERLRDHFDGDPVLTPMLDAALAAEWQKGWVIGESVGRRATMTAVVVSPSEAIEDAAADIRRAMPAIEAEAAAPALLLDAALRRLLTATEFPVMTIEGEAWGRVELARLEPLLGACDAARAALDGSDVRAALAAACCLAGVVRVGRYPAESPCDHQYETADAIIAALAEARPEER